VNSAMTIPRRLGSAAVVATSFPLPVATYLIGPLLVQRVGVIPLALGGSVLVQADWALSSAENSVRLVC
jgi:cadmium resistance protein CadD (predicted permease)